MLYQHYGKRIMDCTLALIGILILSPLFIVLGLFVRVKLGSPVIFKQPRPGKDERSFIMVKFRTMTDERDERGVLLPNDQRMTKFGKLLRATSLDELPELYNVLKGEMSLVGPRPLLEEYLPLYNDEQKKRHRVRPGITGWAQVNGRNAISWDEKFRYDLDYVENHSFLMDMKILFLTVKKVFVREGIQFQEKKGPTKFQGNHESIYVIGSGGFCKQVIEIIEEINRKTPTYTLLGILDDDPDRKGKDLLGVPILGTPEEYLKAAPKNGGKDIFAVIAIGNGKIRQRIAERYPHVGWVNLIHPKTVITKHLKIGVGNIICGGTVINPMTEIKNHCNINIGNTLGHDVTLEDYVTLMPGCRVSGEVTIGKRSLLGTGSIVLQGCTLAEDITLGAGALATKDLKKTGIYIGMPAKEKKQVNQ